MSSGDDRWFLTPLSYLCVTTLRFFSPHNDFDLHSNYSVQLKAALLCIFYSRIRTGTRRRTRWAKRAPSRLTMSRKEKESSREGNSVLCRKFTKIHSRVLACSLDHISPKGGLPSLVVFVFLLCLNSMTPDRHAAPQQLCAPCCSFDFAALSKKEEIKM